MTTDDLAFDQRHIWHPYTSMTSPLPVYPVVSAEGCELICLTADALLTVCRPGGGDPRLRSPAA
ncbi:hypothetical protein ACNKHR_02960 [Shigella flexneri]